MKNWFCKAEISKLFEYPNGLLAYNWIKVKNGNIFLIGRLELVVYSWMESNSLGYIKNLWQIMRLVIA